MEVLAHTMLMDAKIKQISIQISVTPEAKRCVDRIAEVTEIPQKRVLSKLYEWFAALPVPAQKSILWPEETGEEMDAMRVALEYLDRRRESVGKEATPQAEDGKVRVDPKLKASADAKLRDPPPAKRAAS